MIDKKRRWRRQKGVNLSITPLTSLLILWFCEFFMHLCCLFHAFFVNFLVKLTKLDENAEIQQNKVTIVSVPAENVAFFSILSEKFVVQGHLLRIYLCQTMDSHWEQTEVWSQCILKRNTLILRNPRCSPVGFEFMRQWKNPNKP